jgi:hypothetical protein
VSTPQFSGVEQQQRGQRQEIRKTFDIHNMTRENTEGDAAELAIMYIDCGTKGESFRH